MCPYLVPEYSSKETRSSSETILAARAGNLILEPIRVTTTVAYKSVAFDTSKAIDDLLFMDLVTKSIADQLVSEGMLPPPNKPKPTSIVELVNLYKEQYEVSMTLGFVQGEPTGLLIFSGVVPDQRS